MRIIQQLRVHFLVRIAAVRDYQRLDLYHDS